MRRTTSSSLIRTTSRLGVSALAFALVAGCTPSDQQGLSEAAFAALREQVQGLVSFAMDFARRLLAAWLF